MKLSTKTPILSLGGKPVDHPDGTKATFSTIATTSLLKRTARDREVIEIGLVAFALAERIFESDFIELTADEAASIKERVAAFEGWNNLIVGRVVEILDRAEAIALAVPIDQGASHAMVAAQDIAGPAARGGRS